MPMYGFGLNSPWYLFPVHIIIVMCIKNVFSKLYLSGCAINLMGITIGMLQFKYARAMSRYTTANAVKGKSYLTQRSI